MKRKQLFLLILIFIHACLLSGCKQRGIEQAPSYNEIEAMGVDAVVQGADLLGAVSVSEQGIFYIRNDMLLGFYDYAARKEFIMCDQANCRHDDSSCSAYIADSGSITGYACYRGAIYVFQEQRDAASMVLLSMDAGGRNRKTVASLPIAADGPTGWMLTKIDSVYYGEGFAWFRAHYSKHTKEGTARNAESAAQLLAIDLGTGRIYELTDRLDEQTRATFEIIGDGYAVYEVTSRTTPILSEAEYYEQTGTAGDYPSYVEHYYSTTDSKGAIYFFSTQTKQASVFWEGLLTNIYREAEPDRIWYQATPYLFYGFWRGSALYNASYCTNSIDTELRASNLNTGESAAVLTIQNGDALGSYMGEIISTVYQGHILYYLVYEGEERCVIHRYDLNTQEDTVLFTDIRQVSFRIISDTSDKLIGTMNEGQNLCWISKDEFEAGNLKAAVRIFPIF